ncbi:MAG: trypsin-like serine protease, partial [Syntrophomonadaceae bacterium]|nr:trypsin-like serine protease [Syntrophomonadaceae bacterium]
LIGFNYPALFGNTDDKVSLAQPSNTQQIVIMGPTNIADMVEQVSPAVVNIETSASSNYGSSIFNDPFFRQFFGDSFQPKTNIKEGIGTGFVICEDGYVITNQHVIDKADKITVNFNDEEKYDAKVVGQDYELDLAVLKIETNKKLTPLKLGDSDKTRVGEWVIAIGNPYGLDHTVTAGLVSAKGRPINIGDRVYKNLIQTDAAINPGNSGGPLLNVKGEVIGINTAVNAQAQGIGFAIPINTAKDVINELIEKGKVIRPYIGIYIQSVDKELAEYFGIPAEGVIIGNVVPTSPASRAGLQKYDVIVSIDDKKVNTPDEVNEITAKKKVNDRVVLEVLRDGKPIIVTLQLAEKP